MTSRRIIDISAWVSLVLMLLFAQNVGAQSNPTPAAAKGIVRDFYGYLQTYARSQLEGEDFGRSNPKDRIMNDLTHGKEECIIESDLPGDEGYPKKLGSYLINFANLAKKDTVRIEASLKSAEYDKINDTAYLSNVTITLYIEGSIRLKKGYKAEIRFVRGKIDYIKYTDFKDQRLPRRRGKDAIATTVSAGLKMGGAWSYSLGASVGGLFQQDSLLRKARVGAEVMLPFSRRDYAHYPSAVVGEPTTLVYNANATDWALGLTAAYPILEKKRFSGSFQDMHLFAGIGLGMVFYDGWSEWRGDNGFVNHRSVGMYISPSIRAEWNREKYPLWAIDLGYCIGPSRAGTSGLRIGVSSTFYIERNGKNKK